MINFRIASLTSSGGDNVRLSPSGVTCIVGSNNVGKSQLLREIAERAGQKVVSGLVLSGIEVDRDNLLTPGQAESFLKRQAVNRIVAPGNPSQFSPSNGGPVLTVQQFEQFFAMAEDGALAQIRGFFVSHLTAGSLLSVASQSAPGGGEGGSNAISQFFRDGQLEEELSELSRDTFGIPLTLDRVNGDVRFRVDEVDLPVPPLNRPTKEYADSVASLPLLQDQGDGMKSFLDE